MMVRVSFYTSCSRQILFSFVKVKCMVSAYFFVDVEYDEYETPILDNVINNKC